MYWLKIQFVLCVSGLFSDCNERNSRPFIGPLFPLFWCGFFYIVHTFADVVDRFQMQSAIFSDLPENRSAAQTANTHAIRAV